MTIFLVELAESAGQSRVDKTKSMLIEADTAAEAKELAAAQDLGDAPWTDADTTATDVDTLTASDFEGWSYRVRVRPPSSSAKDVADVTVLGVASDTVDLIGTALATALNLDPSIAAASYSTPTLTVAETTDGLGDQAVEVIVTPVGAKASMPSMVGAITDRGASGAALTVALTVPAIVPTLGRKL